MYWHKVLATLLFFLPLHATENGNSGEAPPQANKKERNNSEDLILTPKEAWKEKEPSYYRTPKGASRGIKGRNYPYTLWYDHYAWEETEPLNEHAERSFLLNGGKAYAIIVTDKKQVDLDDLDDIVIKNAKESGFERAKIVKIERRNVNGSDVIFMHWHAVLQGISVDFLSNLYSDDNGSVFIHTYTPSPIFKANRKEMESFLNGFTVEKQQNE